MTEEEYENGTWAFPSIIGDSSGSGMTLRDYFAAKAMQGILSSRGNDSSKYPNLARNAYSLADVMLAARKEDN